MSKGKKGNKGERNPLEGVTFDQLSEKEKKLARLILQSMGPDVEPSSELSLEDAILKYAEENPNVDFSEKERQVIDKLKSAREGISISSDFIVGFPGETEKDFLDTLDLVDRVGYDESFSFIYSPRPNTTAKDLDDDVPLEEKKERLSTLQHKLENSALSISRRMVGEVRKCLVTGVSKKNPGEFQARTENNKVVIFSCSDLSNVGKIIDIEIVEAKNKSLRGVAV